MQGWFGIALQREIASATVLLIEACLVHPVNHLHLAVERILTHAASWAASVDPVSCNRPLVSASSAQVQPSACDPKSSEVRPAAPRPADAPDASTAAVNAALVMDDRMAP